ncbi:DUF2986 domain-containing protein [Vibrio genomosp. F10]|nr:DUF2986 domain-containing protein [Vibrio genomosp. F10]
MNRKKKINQILKKKQKQHNAKLHSSNKPRYISKAERAKMEAEEANKALESSESVQTEQELSADKVSDSAEQQ